MKRMLVILIVLLFFSMGYFLYEHFSYTNILVKFDDLEPFDKQMNVYFKGFKVGKTTKIYPNEDFTNTYLKVKLKSLNVKFPKNISVDVKKKKTGGYVNILYPDEPSLIKLKNNDEIHGLITKDISDLLEGENIQDIVEDTDSLIQSANSAVQSLNNIFVQLGGIISDNRDNINLIVKNLTIASSNLKAFSSSLKSSFQSEDLSSSLHNINKTTENLVGVSAQVNDVTIPIVNNTLCEVNSTAKNVNDISFGIKRTLKKKMGLSRFLFGSPLDIDCY